MRHPPIRITPEIEAVLLREAQLRLESKTIKEIAHAIGASRTFVQERLATLMRQIERQKVVSHGTNNIASFVRAVAVTPARDASVARRDSTDTAPNFHEHE